MKNQNTKVAKKSASASALSTVKALPAPKAQEESRLMRVPSAPDAQRQAIKDAFLNVAAGSVLSGQMRPFVTARTPEDAARAAEIFVEAIRESVRPRDAFEEMLVIQAAWTHARLARLSSIAHSQENRENLQVVHEACDRAANTFRRQMLALAEYRRPAQANSFVAIRQANVANQQVVQNVEPQAQAQSPDSENAAASNEQGSAGSAAPALPPVGGGVDIPAGRGGAEQAVAAEHRPADPGRKRQVKVERHQARRA